MADMRTIYPLFKAFRTAGFGQGYKLYTYTRGTTTPNTTYHDQDLTTPHQNPIILDSTGEDEIYITEPTKLVLKDADGVTVWTADDAAPTSYSAADITYSNTTSGYQATTVQAAIDEIVGELDNISPPPNLIQNAECMIDQRNEGAAINLVGGGGTVSGLGVDRITTTLTTDELDVDVQQSAGIGGCRNSIKITTNTEETAWAAGDYFYPISYGFLGYDVAHLVNGAIVTLSFYFKSNASDGSVFSIAFQPGDAGYSYVTDFTYTTSTEVQFVTKTITIPAHASNYISNTTNAGGFYFYIASVCGTTRQTATTDAWVSGNYKHSTSSIDWTAEASGTGYVQASGFQFVVGSSTGELKKKTRAEYLRECLPYYRKSFDQGVAPAQNTGDDNGALTYYAQEANTADAVHVHFGVPMVSAPTVTFYNVDAANGKWRNATDNGDSGAAAVVSSGLGGITISNPSVATDNPGDKLYVHYSAVSGI